MKVKKFFRQLKKNIGFVAKWTREMIIGHQSQRIKDIDEKMALDYVEKIRPHKYELSEIQPLETKDERELSIIIPAFNAENYIEEAIQSVINACDGIDYEIIIINDASTDATELICQNIQNKVDRIILTDTLTFEEKEKFSNHKIPAGCNKGMSFARNRGITLATGKYIYFLDSDDILIDIRSIYAVGVENDVDIVEGNFVLFDSAKSIDVTKKHLQLVNYGPADIKNDFRHLSNAGGFAWGKIYRRSLWNKVGFPVGFIFEDTIEETYIMRCANRYMFVDEVCQGYRQNPSSICNTVNSTPKSIDSVLVYRLWAEQLEQFGLCDGVFVRLMLKQFGSMTYSRISTRPKEELRKLVVVMYSVLSKFDVPKNLTIYERLLYKAIMTKDFGM